MKENNENRAIKESPQEEGSGVSNKSFFSRHRKLLTSVGIFAGCIIIAIFAYSRFVDSEGMHSLLVLTASATSAILNLFGGGVHTADTLVTSQNFSMRIVAECTGIIPMIIFLSAVIAYPSRLKDKAIGIVIGIFGIYLLNLVRTASLFCIGASFPKIFNTAHYLVWQSLIILAAIALWLVWVEKLTHVSQR